MMWDRVLAEWYLLLINDSDLVGAIGSDATGEPRIYPAQASRKVAIPSIEYITVIDTETELFNPITVQVDYWVKGVGRAAFIERRLRLLTHRDTSRVLGDILLWTRYLDSRTHAYPATEGVVHRSLDFLFEPIREKYYRLSEPES